MQFSRYLKYTFPLHIGDDVQQLQLRLQELNYQIVGQPDGKFGADTDKAVRAYQQDLGLLVDGIVGPNTWNKIFAGKDVPNKIETVLPELTEFHKYRESVQWRLQRKGIEIHGSGFEYPSTGKRTPNLVWERFSYAIEEWSEKFMVPAELIVATICTESSGDPSAIRRESGYISDESTPHRISIGLMQTLISTARVAISDQTIDGQWLLDPGNSIKAGTAYIASQWLETNLDPPKVACAYNAGGIYHNDSDENRWKMRQFPIGSSKHADRYIRYFNQFYTYLEKENIQPKVSFWELLG